MAFSQSVRKSQVPVKCNLCENETIKWKCEDCGLLLCTNCRDTKHTKIKNAQNHRIIDIKQVGVHSEEVDYTNIKCKNHSGQLCCLFCSNCDSLVCPICIAKIHKKHDLIEISEEFNTKIESLKKGQSKIQTNRTKLETKKEFLEQCKSRENEKFSKVIQNIQNHGKVLKLTIDKYIEKLKNEVSENLKAIIHSIDTDLDVIVRSMKETDDRNNETENLINATDINKFFREVFQIEKSIDIPVPKTQSLYYSIPKFVPGEITQSNVGALQSDDSPVEISVNLNIISEYQTEVSVVSDLVSCPDKSIWINSNKDGKLMEVKPEGNILKPISSFNIKVYGMAALPSNDILLSTAGKSRLQQLSVTTGKLTDSVYDVDPLAITAIHITSGNKVVVGGNNKKLGRKAVLVINEKGDHETVYEHDKHNQPIFNYPQSISSTRNGNVHVVDCHSDRDRGRVVVLGQEGGVVNTYTGHTEVNKDKPFKPVKIVTTPRDKVIVVDANTRVIHILNNVGEYLTHLTFNTRIRPFSLAFTPTGQLYMGCTRPKGSTAKEAKIYQVTLSG